MTDKQEFAKIMYKEKERGHRYLIYYICNKFLESKEVSIEEYKQSDAPIMKVDNRKDIK